MPKHILALVFSLFLFTATFAQTGGLIYYLKNSGKLVLTKDSADYSMVVLPPDTGVDKNLYQVYEYYKDGKIMLITSSTTNDINLRYQGHYMAYYPNGHRMKMGTLEDGLPVGNETEYYPNGKLYNIKNYIMPNNDLSADDQPVKKREFLSECRDSTGVVLAANGNGKWIEFDADFKNVTGEGQIAHGDKDSIWYVKNDGLVTRKEIYKDGELLSSANPDGSDNITYSTIEGVPEFPGGIQEFGKFLSKNIRYPAVARENRIQGKVIVSFIVERDGSLTDVHVSRRIGGGCDDEAVRVIKLTSPWKPGFQNGHPVSVSYSVPISFALSN